MKSPSPKPQTWSNEPLTPSQQSSATHAYPHSFAANSSTRNAEPNNSQHKSTHTKEKPAMDTNHLQQQNTSLRNQLDKRMRLVWAAMIFGIIAGMALMAIIAMPPVTFGPEVWS